MKTWLPTILLSSAVCGVLATTWARAASDETPPAEGVSSREHLPGEPPNALHEGAPPFRGELAEGRPGRGDGRRSGRGALESWLEHMRRENPEEFERLMTLREEDPEAFRQALRSRRDGLREHGAPEGRSGDRRVQGAPRDLPPEEQRRPMAGFARGRDGSGAKDPAITRLEQQTRRLVNACRNASGEERDQLHAKLRVNLEEIFELRERQRREMVERMSRKLETLREELEKRDKQRDKLIDRRMEELLSTGSYSTTGASAQSVSRA